jgi:hypothetical protein
MGYLIHTLHSNADNPGYLLISGVAGLIAFIMVALATLDACRFIYGQAVAVVSVYLFWETESLEDFHPYTQAILRNECPEMVELRALRALPKGRENRAAQRAIIQSMVNMLEAHERQAVKHSLIRELKALA